MAILTGKQIDLLFGRAVKERSLWEHQWQDVSNLILPSRQFTTKKPAGGRRRNFIFDDTATKSNIRIAAALHSLLVNPAIKWFTLATQSERVNEIHHVKIWLRQVGEHLLNIFNNPKSGFSTHIHEIFLDLPGFGTAIFMVLDGHTRTKFTSRPLSECYLVEDEEGRVVGVFRKFTMKPDQLAARAEKSGWDLSAKIMQNLRSENGADMDKDVEVLHYVYERDSTNPLRKDGPNMPWASVYVDFEQKHVMHTGGFQINPFKTPRWSKAPGEVYGTGPGIDAMPSIKGLNVMKRTILEAGEKAVNPPLLVPSGGVDGQVNSAPRSLIYYKAGLGGTRNDPIRPLAVTNPELGEGLLEVERANVKEMFFLDLLQLPELDRMTATEVTERVQQRLGIMSPVLARIQAELISPIIEHTFAIEAKSGRIPPAPEEIMSANLSIEYVSPLALAQRSSEASNILRLLNAAAPMGDEILDVLKSDETIRALGGFYNVSPKLLRTSEEVQQIRQERQELQQAQQVASAAKDAGQAAQSAQAAGLGAEGG